MSPSPRCDACAALPDYLEVEDEPLPSTTVHLASPSPDLARAYELTDENLLACPSCGTYYGWRLWHPGGSCDAMQTCTHEALWRMRIAAVPLELGARVPELTAGRERFRGTSLEEHYTAALAGVHAELARLEARAAEILSDAVDWIQTRHAGSEAFLASHDGVMPAWYPDGHLEKMRAPESSPLRVVAHACSRSTRRSLTTDRGVFVSPPCSQTKTSRSARRRPPSQTEARSARERDARRTSRLRLEWRGEAYCARSGTSHRPTECPADRSTHTHAGRIKNITWSCSTSSASSTRILATVPRSGRPGPP